MGKRTSFVTNLFVALVGVVVLSVGQFSASANTGTGILASTTNIWVLVGVLILLVAFLWFLRSTRTENVPSGKMSIEDLTIEPKKENITPETINESVDIKKDEEKK